MMNSKKYASILLFLLPFLLLADKPHLLLLKTYKNQNINGWVMSEKLDGELWTKRKDFENISSIVRDKVPSDKWREITHNTFEVPHAKGGLFKRLSKVKPSDGKVIKIIPQVKIKDKAHLEKFLKEIEAKGGEGVVVRDPKASYIDKRTNKALKVKNFKDDECMVMAHNIGHGFSYKQIKYPPVIGSLITFKYKEITKYGKPMFPVFLRIRNKMMER